MLAGGVPALAGVNRVLESLPSYQVLDMRRYSATRSATLQPEIIESLNDTPSR